MFLDINLISVLDSAGVIQGLAFGIMLLVINKRRKNYSYCLGLILILYSLQRVTVVFAELNIFELYPELFLLPTISYWLLFPIFFIYTQKISILSEKKNKIWLLYPGIAYFIFQLYIFLLPYETKLIIAEQSWFITPKFIGLFYGWVVAIWNLKFIENHKREVLNQYTETKNKELKWVKQFIIFALIATVVYAFQFYLLPKNIYSRVFFLCIDLTIIYWLSFYGIMQTNIHSVIAQDTNNKTTATPSLVLKNQQRVDYKELKTLVDRIENHLLETELYTESELTIVEVANLLDVHPRKVSTAINTIKKQNFNNYINRFRVEKAITVLQSKDAEHFSVEGIGNKVGFKSKSAFYSSFKKETGTTPTQYLQQALVEK
ncbi:AraC family transcriptional regulator [Aurantibacter sp.]|uniref:helix-turn-helix domain-containing protein n=1 Tax=Aurantibacter sp. TaxID=2807103 RepID=UPI0032670219